ncbi:unnamed protein product [Prorocentrum cordatum]|uniref:Uncharacterized protein n=1 Tax=Prorocentrum cordatum TaxID=2364126 RepID=A0ABN9VG76_9DINO|nr:unnamed protein product [Polarella glacialis]
MTPVVLVVRAESRGRTRAIRGIVRRRNKERASFQQHASQPCAPRRGGRIRRVSSLSSGLADSESGSEIARLCAVYSDCCHRRVCDGTTGSRWQACCCLCARAWAFGCLIVIPCAWIQRAREPRFALVLPCIQIACQWDVHISLPAVPIRSLTCGSCRPLRSYCSDHAPVWASFDISPGKPISKLSAAANAGPYDAEVMDAEGLWRAGRIVDRRGAAGGTYELLIARGPPAAPPHFQLWRNVLDRGQRWRQLEQPATLEVYSVSARAWCPGARASRADRQLGEGQFVARFRMPDGASWAEKILESADQEKTWRFLVAPQ